MLSGVEGVDSLQGRYCKAGGGGGGGGCIWSVWGAGSSSTIASSMAMSALVLAPSVARFPESSVRTSSLKSIPLSREGSRHRTTLAIIMLVVQLAPHGGSGSRNKEVQFYPVPPFLIL